MVLKNLFTITCLTLSISVNAAIVDLGLHTRDTSTGLDWLDLSVTAGMSLSDISSELANGGTLSNYRYASGSEVDTLWGTLDPAYNPLSLYSPYLQFQLDSFVDSVGLLGGSVSPDVDGNIVFRGYAALNNPMEIVDLGIPFGPHTEMVDHTIRFNYGPYGEEIGGFGQIQGRRVTGNNALALLPVDANGLPVSTYTEPDQFTYLVKQSPVPIPAAGWLLGSALIGLGAMRRKTS